MSYPAGTLDLERIKDTIYDWVRDITQGAFPEGEEHIQWQDQTRPLQARPCITLKIIDGPRPIARSGNMHFNPIPGSPMPVQSNPFTVGVQQEATISVQSFGNTQVHKPMAMQLAFDLNSSLIRQSVLDKLKRGGVSIQEVGKPRNLTALEESEYEERAGFEILIGLSQNLKDQPGTIATINADVTTPSGDRNTEISLPQGGS